MVGRGRRPPWESVVLRRGLPHAGVVRHASRYAVALRRGRSSTLLPWLGGTGTDDPGLADGIWGTRRPPVGTDSGGRGDESRRRTPRFAVHECELYRPGNYGYWDGVTAGTVSRFDF